MFLAIVMNAVTAPANKFAVIYGISTNTILPSTNAILPGATIYSCLASSV